MPAGLCIVVGGGTASLVSYTKADCCRVILQGYMSFRNGIFYLLIRWRYAIFSNILFLILRAEERKLEDHLASHDVPDMGSISSSLCQEIYVVFWTFKVLLTFAIL